MGLRGCVDGTGVVEVFGGAKESINMIRSWPCGVVMQTMEERLCLSGATAAPDCFFPIGVWSQPVYSFATWKARGVNTMVNYESEGGTVSIDQWSNAVDALGLYQIRQPRGNPALDIKETSLLAWMNNDEPDVNGVGLSVLAANYTKWKAVDPGMPIFTNLSGEICSTA